MELSNSEVHIGKYEADLKFENSYEDWQQFTGLHDKNGKEIFEGDIMDMTDEYGSKRHQVKWIDCRFNLSPEAVHEFKMEVIGNIYENPDLLSQ